jgi:hypothetical protein
LQIDDLWGPHPFDRFAFDYNSHCMKFSYRWSCPGTCGIDAFKYHWSGENNGLGSPPRLLPETIKKLSLDKASGTVVVPEWKTAAFWPMLFKESGEYKVYKVLARVDLKTSLYNSVLYEPIGEYKAAVLPTSGRNIVFKLTSARTFFSYNLYINK